MSPDSARGAQAELRVRFAADAASVPAARRFVRDGLTTWGRPGLVEDAALCVTELTSNAALHSSSRFFEIRVLDLRETVRISVSDKGTVPVEAVVPRQPRPLAAGEEVNGLPLADYPTTGRGLVIVSTLASAWGIEETADGKAVWVELAQNGDEYPVRPPQTTSQQQPANDWQSQGLPAGWRVVRLAACPVVLSLRQDQHLDELIRELQLIEGHPEHPPSDRLSAVISGLLQRGAHVRHTGRRTAQDAAAAGLDVIDVDLAMPVHMAQLVRDLNRAVHAADALCEERELLTLASTPDVRALRNWMTEEFGRQLERGEPPVPWSTWQANRA
jgi:anti-sigma regulatory factor (Ser/Thr protein kinase)